MEYWKKFKQQKLNELKEHEETGKADEGIMPLVHRINTNPGLVTTSSCAGRIVFLEYDLEEGKKTSGSHKKWHRIVRAEEVELALCQYSEEKTLWFKVEPFILHVAAKDLKAAANFLKLVRSVGVKRGGIQSVSKDKVIIEVQGNGQMIIPVGPTNAEWTKLVLIANKMFSKNLEMIKKMEKLKWKPSSRR